MFGFLEFLFEGLEGLGFGFGFGLGLLSLLSLLGGLGCGLGLGCFGGGWRLVCLGFDA